MALLVRNNAASTLQSSVTGSTLELNLPSGHGSRFPLPASGDFFIVTVQEGSAFEIMRCTARNDDELTVQRAQEGTTAQGFSAGSTVTMRITAGVLQALQAELADIADDAAAAAASASAANVTATAAQAAATAAANTRVPLAGGAMTGALSLAYNNPAVSLSKQASGQAANIFGLTTTQLRWALILGDNNPESGANAGSHFTVYRYNDAGAYAGQPFWINRANGRTNINEGLTLNGTVTSSGTITSDIGVYAGSGLNGRAAMIAGNPTNPGYVEFRTADNTRRGYVGFGISSKLALVAESGWEWTVFGNMTFNNITYHDSGFVIVRNNTSPQVVFQNLSGAEQGRIFTFGGSAMAFHAGSSSFQLNGSTLYGPQRDSDATGGVAQIESSTSSGGVSDGVIAAYSFHIPGAYRTKLKMRGDGVVGIGGNSASSWRWYVNTVNGDMTAAGNVFAYSDRRLKEHLSYIEDPLRIVNAITGYTFTWKKDAGAIVGKPGTRDTGLLAQELQNVEHLIPGVISESPTASFEDGFRPLTVAYDKLVPVLVEAIKVLNERIKQLENR